MGANNKLFINIKGHFDTTNILATNINTPTVIPWGHTNKQTNKQTDKYLLSGISSHSMGARIYLTIPS